MNAADALQNVKDGHPDRRVLFLEKGDHAFHNFLSRRSHQRFYGLSLLEIVTVLRRVMKRSSSSPPRPSM
jgi:DNA-binding FadR family transcriptional regulator